MVKNYSVILLAAGSGTRLNLGYNKIFLEIKHIPLITLPTRIFFNDPHCRQLIFVGQTKELPQLKELFSKYDLVDDRCQFIEGGTERQYSVANGLEFVLEDYVLIHDGARPFITDTLITELLSACVETGCSLPGTKVKDTVKVVHQGMVQQTLDRSTLYNVQTPQAVKTKLIRQAHQYAQQDQLLMTDDASLIEYYKLSPVRIIEGPYDNIKVTTSIDLDIAEKLIDKYTTIEGAK